MTLRERLRRFISFDDREFTGNPVIHHFPKVGRDGQITIDCVISPSAWPLDEDASLDEKADGRVKRVAPKRVGALLVEFDEYGLRIIWKPAKEADASFLSPLPCPPAGEPPAKPTEERRDNKNK